MHEASLSRDLLNRVQTQALEQKARQGTQVQVWLGALSHMSVDHFHEHVAREAKNTIAEGAELRVDLSDDIDAPDAQSLMLCAIEVDV